MSLFAVYVDQVCRPSFLPTYYAPMRRQAQAVATEKRDQVLACLRRAGKKVTTTWIVDYTGYTKNSVTHILCGLAKDGLVVRRESAWEHKPGTCFIFWEAS